MKDPESERRYHRAHCGLLRAAMGGCRLVPPLALAVIVTAAGEAIAQSLHDPSANALRFQLRSAERAPASTDLQTRELQRDLRLENPPSRPQDPERFRLQRRIDQLARDPEEREEIVPPPTPVAPFNLPSTIDLADEPIVLVPLEGGLLGALLDRAESALAQGRVAQAASDLSTAAATVGPETPDLQRRRLDELRQAVGTARR